MSDRNILFAAEFWHGATGRALTEGLRKLDWCVHEHDDHDYFPLGRRFSDRVFQRLLHRSHIASFNEALLRQADVYRPRFFLTVKGVFVTRETLHELRRRNIMTVNFYPDVEFGHAGSAGTPIEDYDLVVTTKSFHLDYLHTRLGEDRVRFIHHGYVPTAHRPIDIPADDAGFVRDIFYSGNASDYKLNWMLAVKAAFPDRTVTVMGHRWAEMVVGTLLEGCARPFAAGEFYAREAGRSRINIALHMGSTGPRGWQDGVSTRTFEIPASRGFMLHIDNPEVRGLFEVPGEIDTFTTPEQLIEKIGHYLDRPEQRREMVERAYRRTVPAYSTDSRAAELDRVLSDLR